MEPLEVVDELAPPPAKKSKPFQNSSVSSPAPNTDSDASKGPDYIREEEVGITQYVSQHPGLFAILKQRYSDFIVHELSLDGDQVQLTTFDLPKDLPLPPSMRLEEVFSSTDVTKLQCLSENDSTTDTVVIVLDADVSKDQRKDMHKAIREHFPNLESATEDSENGGKKILVQKAGSNPKRQGFQARGRWPQGRGDYCQFVLYKENKDTMEAINLISRILKVKSSVFHYAGTKDRRAITSQRVTAFRVPAEKIITLNSSCKNIKVGNFSYTTEQLRLGDLSGNRFSIILRKLSCDDHMIEAPFTSLRDVGFVNYFGMQRFGTSVVPTHSIGRHLIHSDWEGAIGQILQPRLGDCEEVNGAREYYLSTKDATGALKRMPKWKAVEWQLLQGLERHAEKKNFLGALNFIPRNTRLMYVHSWQSYIWNRVVSWRLKTFGVTPVLGDLVCEMNTLRGHSLKSKVEVITKERLSDYTIHDVVLPLPGFDVQWPENETKEEMMHLLSEDGVSLDQLQHRVKEFSLPGNYRHIVSKPQDVTWELMDYNDTTEPLLLTDLDLMNGKPPPSSLSGGKFKALKVEFSLPSSTYATMALREVLKMDTSSAYQTTLNEESV